MKRKHEFGLKVVTFIFLALEAAFCMTVALSSLPLSYFLGMASITAGLTGALIVYNKFVNEESLMLTWSDIYKMVKFGVLSVALTAGDTIVIISMLFYEKMYYAKAESMCAKALEEIEMNDYSVLEFLDIYIRKPIAIIFKGLWPVMLLAFILATGMIVWILSFGVMSTAMLILFLVPEHILMFALLSYGAIYMGYDETILFTLPTKTPNDDEKTLFGSISRNFTWMLLAFIIASPTLWMPLLFSGFWTSIGNFIALVTDMQYIMTSTAWLVFYLIQPLMEEIIFRGLFFRYCVAEGLCSEDYKDMGFGQQMFYALLNGALFAFWHQVSKGYVSLLSFIPLAVAGTLAAMLTFLSGRIDLSTFEHMFHNLSCAIFPQFVMLYYMKGYEFTQYITPFTSAFFKHQVVFNLEEEYCQSDHTAKIPSNVGTPMAA